MSDWFGIIRDWLEGLQDCGAGGYHIVDSGNGRAREGSGIRIQTQHVPRRESGMTPYEVMLSESQERMIAAVKPAPRGRRCKPGSSIGTFMQK